MSIDPATAHGGKCVDRLALRASADRDRSAQRACRENGASHATSAPALSALIREPDGQPCAYVACRPSDTHSHPAVPAGPEPGLVRSHGSTARACRRRVKSGQWARSWRGPFSPVVDRRRSRAAPPGCAHPAPAAAQSPGPAADRQRADFGSGRRRCRHDQNGTVTDDDSVRSLIVSTRLLGTREIMIINHRRPRDVSRDIQVLPLPVACPQQLWCGRLGTGRVKMFASVAEKRRVEQG